MSPSHTHCSARRRATALLVALAQVLTLSTLAAAQDRTLSWDSLTVEANLDVDGRLWVTETHAMRMNGAWNGGERRFRLSPRHSLQLLSVREIVPDGPARAYIPGTLDQVGQYAFRDGKTLRWRARAPNEAPFRDALRTFELRYVLSGILVPVGQEYLLDHDFAFPDRDGVIQQFSATLQLAPAWSSVEPFEPTLARASLAPGRSAVRRVTLHYAGSGRPAAAADRAAALALTASPALSASLFFGLLLVAALGFVRIRHRARTSGHVAPLPDSALIDRAWLDEHVFCHPAEVVGAAWDRHIGAPEVAALIARMTAEGKLKSRVNARSPNDDEPNLRLELRTDRKRLRGYERALIDGMFFDGDTTDTWSIRSHYASSGFDPAKLIARELRDEVDGRFGKQRPLRRWPHLLAIGAAALLSITLHATNESETTAAWTMSSTILTLIAWAVARYQARKYRDTVTEVRSRAQKTAVAVASLLAWLAFVQLVAHAELSILQLWLLDLLVLLAFWHIASALEPCELAISYQLRRQIAAARAYFARELEAPAPRIEDAWFPYLIAFDLGPDMARWFGAFGGRRPEHRDDNRWPESASSTPSASSVSHAPSWSGGGGAFGGAGAQGTWAVAAGAVAAGVSAPSSSSDSGSSSSGSSSSSSSSSGGGGGGGW